MSRVIKFRVWAGGYMKQWVEWASFVHNSCLSVNEVFAQPEYIFEQFTGLLDKNGREIYEGDILRIARWDGQQVVYDQIGVVYWWEQAARFSIWTDKGLARIDDLNTSSGGVLDEKTRDEVIGNIHENPDLTKT